MLPHVTHNFIINSVEGLFPLASEAHCWYTSLHKFVTTINRKTLLSLPLPIYNKKAKKVIDYVKFHKHQQTNNASHCIEI